MSRYNGPWWQRYDWEDIETISPISPNAWDDDREIIGKIYSPSGQVLKIVEHPRRQFGYGRVNGTSN